MDSRLANCEAELAFLQNCSEFPVLTRASPFEGCEGLRPQVFRNATLPQEKGLPPLEIPGRWGDSRHGYKMTAALADAVRARVQPGEVIIELGTYLGFATYHLAYNAQPGVQVVTVDSGSSNATGVDHKRRYPEYQVGLAFQRAPWWLRSRITQVISRTSDFDPSPYRGRVSLVWVDAGHSLQACLQDSLLAISLVEPGGYVLWDDVSAAWPGVVLCMRRLQTRLRNSTAITVTEDLKPWASMDATQDPLSVHVRDTWWQAEKQRIEGADRSKNAIDSASPRAGELSGGYFVALGRRATAWYRRPC